MEHHSTVISLFLNFEIIMPKRRGSTKINNKRDELVGKLASGKQILYERLRFSDFLFQGAIKKAPLRLVLNRLLLNLEMD